MREFSSSEYNDKVRDADAIKKAEAAKILEEMQKHQELIASGVIKLSTGIDSDLERLVFGVDELSDVVDDVQRGEKVLHDIFPDLPADSFKQLTPEEVDKFIALLTEHPFKRKDFGEKVNSLRMRSQSSSWHSDLALIIRQETKEFAFSGSGAARRAERELEILKQLRKDILEILSAEQSLSKEFNSLRSILAGEIEAGAVIVRETNHEHLEEAINTFKHMHANEITYDHFLAGHIQQLVKRIDALLETTAVSPMGHAVRTWLLNLRGALGHALEKMAESKKLWDRFQVAMDTLDQLSRLK